MIWFPMAQHGDVVTAMDMDDQKVDTFDPGSIDTDRLGAGCFRLTLQRGRVNIASRVVVNEDPHGN